MLQLTPHPANAPYRHPWKNTCCQGRANEILRADVQAHLTKAQKDIGYKYIRFHAIFHDDMQIVHRRKDGTLSFQWHQVDKVYDFLLSVGLRPFVELSSMPRAMTDSPHFGCHFRFLGGLPKDWNEWSQLVEEFARHLVDRYGAEEVSQWYFEVWNEPNIGTEKHGFWQAGLEEYLELYRRAAEAIKGVHPSLRVGGPASAFAGYVEELIDYCDEKGVALDFITTHLYPQDEYQHYKSREESPYPLGYFFIQKMKEVRELVERKKPGMEIHITEWSAMSAPNHESIQWGSNLTNDKLFAASFVCHAASALDGDLNSLGYWIVSDIFDEWPIQNAPFTATYGLLTIHGFAKAPYNAFRLMAKIRGPRMDIQTSADKPEFANVIASTEAGVFKALLWNWETLETIGQQATWEDTLEIPVEGDQYLAITARITERQGSAWEAWMDMDAPLNVSPTEVEALEFAAEPLWRTRLLEPENGKIKLSFKVPPKDVLYIEIRPRSEKPFKKGTENDEFNQYQKPKTDFA